MFTLTILLFTIGFGSYQNMKEEPSKVDSYNDKIRSSEAEQWHLEDFREKLLKEPNARAYIIAYGGREDSPGKAGRYAWRARNWLIEWRGIEATRIVAIDGGRREEFIVELWLVPAKARDPQPAPSVEVRDDLGDNLLYDEFGIGYDNFASKAEDAAARLDGFAVALRKEPKSWGCVIAYAESGDDLSGAEWDAPGTALRAAQAQRQYLIRKHGIAAFQLNAVDGGYSSRVVQLWIMRPDARFDKGPFVYPSRLIAKRNGTLTISRNSSKLCCKACARGRTNRSILSGR